LAEERIFSETMLPPRQVVIFGKGHDVAAVVNAAEMLGWEVSVASPPKMESGLADEETAAIIMSHNYLLDQQALKNLLASEVGYIGLLGPQRRAERMLSELGLPMDERLHSPIGLNIGAEGPEQIAIAIVAEIQAWFAGRAGGFLRDNNVKCNLSA